MYFRSRKKLQGEVSLSDSIETDQDGNDLMLMDVVGVDDTMLSDLQDREDSVLVRPSGARMPDRPRARDRHAALRPRGPDAAHPARDRKKTRHLKKLVSRIEKRALEKLEEAIGERG